MAVKQPEVREVCNKSLITHVRVEYGIIIWCIIYRRPEARGGSRGSIKPQKTDV